jgi:glycosyltransferase involved in cell wall biosynthesis
MKILFVHDNAWVCQTLAGALNEMGHFAYVISKDRPQIDCLGAESVFTINSDQLMPTLISVLRRNEVNVKEINLINTNDYASWITGEFIKKFLNIPHVVTLHGSDIRNLIQGKMSALKRNLLTTTLKRSNMFFATTPDLLVYSHIIRRKILHLPLPIDTDLFNNRAAKNELLFGDPIVFSPTRLQENKGAKNIIKILRRIVEDYPSSHIYQVKWGRPDYISILLNTIPSENLTFVNFIPRNLLPSWYVSSDIVIGQMSLGIISTIELEAMSCKTPVIVYDRYYDYGYGRRDLENAWEMTYKTISDQAFRKKLIEKGSRIIEEKHDVNLVVELYLKYLKQVLPVSSYH